MRDGALPYPPCPAHATNCQVLVLFAHEASPAIVHEVRTGNHSHQIDQLHLLGDALHSRAGCTWDVHDELYQAYKSHYCKPELPRSLLLNVSHEKDNSGIDHRSPQIEKLVPLSRPHDPQDLLRARVSPERDDFLHPSAPF